MLRQVREEEGSSIVEATIVLPLFILTVIFMLLLIIHYSKFSFKQINGNSYLNFIVGKENKNRDTDYSKESFSYKYSKDVISKYIESNVFEDSKGINRNFLFKNWIESKDRLRIYSINEKKLILYKDVLNEE